jgi:hypothetical protein
MSRWLSAPSKRVRWWLRQFAVLDVVPGEDPVGSGTVALVGRIGVARSHLFFGFNFLSNAVGAVASACKAWADVATSGVRFGFGVERVHQRGTVVVDSQSSGRGRRKQYLRNQRAGGV